MPEEINKAGYKASDNLFPVVGVGASAGGLDAFKAFIKGISVDSGMAYILVQHLSPQYESMLAEILQIGTKLPVIEIIDHLKVLPDHIYIIPSNKLLIANDGVLELYPHIREEKTNVIDLFFTSLAEIHGEQAIGVILSGTGSDGTMGLKTIRDVGGITIVQDKESSSYYGMPQSAIDAEVVDYVLPPGKMAAHLFEVIQHSQQFSKDVSGKEGAIKEDFFKQILALLRAKNGLDFTYYKQTTIRRRILRRMALHKTFKLIDYKELLLENKAEQDALFKDLLIPVTSFFRDPKTFSYLSEQVFPLILKGTPGPASVRIWVPGCSTGEEAYSIAMCLDEFLGGQHSPGSLQIFATDISESVIAKARNGLFQKKDMAGVSEERINKFFTKSDGGFLVNKAIREMCVFATQNFLKDPPFARLDLISCRNVLIYMEPYLQKKAFSTFHYALKPGGFLFLGKSESVGNASELFQVFSQHEKLFTRKTGTGKYMAITSDRNEAALKKKNDEVRNIRENKDDYQKAADEALLSKYETAGVIVNDQLEIVQFRGATGPYLEAPPGKASHHLLRMAREGLSFELRSALHTARSTNNSIYKSGIPLDKANRLVDIEVIPLLHTIDLYFLVLFTDTVRQEISPANETDRVLTASESTALDIANSRIVLLEKELLQAREDMRNITEEQEAVNEELQSANEELLSGNEELQSLNEELETTKEEVDSSNEELTLLNQELFDRNEQLINLRKYSDAIITTIHDSLIVLNKDLAIRSANHSFYEKFELTEKQCVGKSFLSIANGAWNLSSFNERLLRIVPEHSQFENIEMTVVAGSSGERILSFNARQIINEVGTEQLILVAIQDVTERKLLQQQLDSREKEIRRVLGIQKTLFQNMIMQSPAFAAMWEGPDHLFSLVNPAYQNIFGNRPLKGLKLLEAVPELKNQDFLSVLDKVYQTGEIFVGNEILIAVAPGIGREIEPMYFNLSVQPVFDEHNHIQGVLGLGYDATQQVNAKKQSEENLRTILESMNQISWTASAKGDFTFFNRPFFEYTGLTSAFVFEKQWSAFIHPSHVESNSTLWNESVLSGEDYYNEFLLKGPDDVYHWHVARATPVRDNNGVIQLWVGSAVDIHNQKIFSQELELQVKQRTSELQETNRNLQYSNENLQQFATIASHDLQEPLRKIKTFVSILNRRYATAVPEDARDVIRKIQSSADRMSQLIKEVLEYSRVMNSAKTFLDADLNGILLNVLEDVGLLIADTRAVINYPKPLPVIQANPLQMHQLFYNLLTNALKFYKETEAPEINILFSSPSPDSLVKWPDLSSGREYIEIVFSDKGIGFEPQFAQQIFQIFERLHNTEEFEGTGIGLALCKKIVENHNGFIFADSEENKGAKFHVIIPVTQ